MLAAHQPEPAPDRRLPFLRRIILKDYKSIENAAIELEAVTVLVGRNGSGKSNFLDALRFVAEGLQVSLDHAVKSRAGVDEIRRRGAPRSFSLELQIELPGGGSAVYHLVIGGIAGSFEVDTEVLKISSKAGDLIGHYEMRSGKIIRASLNNPPPAQTDRLYLVTASGLPEFRPVYDALASMSFYDLDPEAMRILQAPDSGDLLRRNGSNIASVVGRLRAEQPEILERIAQYLAAIVPGLVDVERVSLGPRETLKFKQLTGEPASPQEFFAWSMSDGTLRVVGTLAAAFQFADRKTPGLLVGIEEPETSLHPAASGALMDALLEASTFTQVLLTSHSPDLLDHADLETESILSVALEEGITKIAPIDKASLKVIRDHLFSPGELLRMDQLDPDRGDLERQERELEKA